MSTGPTPTNQTNINTIPGVAELEGLRPTTRLGRAGQALGIAALVFLGIWLNNATRNPPNVVVNPPPAPAPPSEPPPTIPEPVPPDSLITPLSLSPAAPGPTVTVDGRTMRLGRRKPVRRFTGLHLRNFLDLAAAGPPPDHVDYASKSLASLKRAYGNDVQGDCAWAALYHMIGLWTGNASGTPDVVSDAEVLATYHMVTGPGDNGTILTDMLDYAKTRGVPVNGARRKILDYIAVDTTDPTLVKWAVDIFGTVLVGIDLPEPYFHTDDWGTFSRPVPNAGGHAIMYTGYGADDVTADSWGLSKKFTWPAQRTFVEEAYVVLSEDWVDRINTSHLSPSGLDIAGLKTALADLKAGRTPTIPPVPPPAPAPIPVPVPVPTPAPPIANGTRIDLYLHRDGPAPAPAPPPPDAAADARHMKAWAAGVDAWDAAIGAGKGWREAIDAFRAAYGKVWEPAGAKKAA